MFQITEKNKKNNHASNASGQWLSESQMEIFICLIRTLSRKRMLLMRISELFFDSHQSIQEDIFFCLHYLRTKWQKKYVLNCIWTVRFLTSPVSCMCFRGMQNMNLKVIDGGPLPFAFDILTTVFHYGNRAFVKYPKDIPDYFKQSFPEGYCWERSMAYEDGGISIATNDIT